MISVPFISQLPQPVSTLVLVGLLVAAFVIAFKVMEMVMQTVIVSILSGGFYVSLVYLFNYSFSLDTLIFYSFAGAALYMGYSFLVSAYGIAARLVEIPYRLLVFILRPFINGVESLLQELRQIEIDHGSEDEDSEDPGSTKEVVLNKVNEEED
ncbi:MAG: hypothetical protein ABEJ98_01015 [Candidatus Nanohaloarchaea archaeon]